MKILDGHIHQRMKYDDTSGFADRQLSGGVSGGVILSIPPAGHNVEQAGLTAAERISSVVGCTSPEQRLYPAFWIDPVGDAAEEEVDRAIEAGISAFKVICSDFYPGDPRALETYRRIAATGKPILFHSGILWDGKNSSKYNRPAEFEALIDIDGLRFSLAHISWPWCDEHIAVYGKFLAASLSGAEMFIDTTPGTPRIYRREALTKIYTVGYDVANNIFFGTDCMAPDYNGEWAAEWIARDRSILQELGISMDHIDGYFCTNLERFLGVTADSVTRKRPRPGE